MVFVAQGTYYTPCAIFYDIPLLIFAKIYYNILNTMPMRRKIDVDCGA